MNTTRRTLNATIVSILATLSLTALPALAETVIVESRTTNAAASITADPPYGEITPGNFSSTSGKSSASDTTALRVGSRFGYQNVPSVRITPTLVPNATYTMDLAHPIAAGNTTTNVVVNITYSGCTGTLSSTTNFNRVVGNVWENIGSITVDPGITQPSITFTYASGTIDSSLNRWYVDAFRFVNQSDPCVAGLAALNTVNGPLQAEQTFVDVPGVSGSAVAVTVYANGLPTGEKNSGVTAGVNRVTTSPLVKGQVITATQRNGSAVDSCRPNTGGIVGGGNPRVRLALSIRQNADLTGPIGANGGTAGSILKFLGATNAVAGSGCPMGAKILYPSNDWQTVTLLRGPDPANPTDRTYRWNGTDATHDLLGNFGVLEALAFGIDDLTDTGPFVIYIDTLANGNTVIQDFDSYANNALTVQFNAPSFSGSTGPFLFPPAAPVPNLSRVTNAASDAGGKSAVVSWQFKDTQVGNWLRLVAQGTGTPNPQVDLNQPITMRVLYLPPGAALPSGAPTINTQPQSTTVVQNGGVTLSVSAGGTGPLFYQWFEAGAPVSDATNRTLHLSNVPLSDPRTFSVTVSNLVGSTNSADAVLTVLAAPFSSVMNPLWELAAGSTYYFTNDGALRCLAYNPAGAPTPHLLVVSKSPSNAIHVLEAETGLYLYSMDVSSIAGGALALNSVACTADGQIFAGNLTLNGTNTEFRLYGWFDDQPGIAPFIAWTGNPNGDTNRWGDTLDVRGTGGGVEAIIGSGGDRKVASLRNLFIIPSAPAIVVDVPDAEPGNFSHGLQWGAGDDFWGKSRGTALRHVDVDWLSNLGSVRTTNTDFPNMTAIGVDPARKTMAGVVHENPHTLRLLDISVETNAVVIDTEFLGETANPEGVGSVRFAPTRLFVLDGNNRISAYQLGGRLSHSLNGTMLTLTWEAGFTLQSTPDLDVPFTDVMGATSPLTVDTSAGGNLFYRLRN